MAVTNLQSDRSARFFPGTGETKVSLAVAPSAANDLSGDTEGGSSYGRDKYIGTIAEVCSTVTVVCGDDGLELEPSGTATFYITAIQVPDAVPTTAFRVFSGDPDLNASLVRQIPGLG